MIFLYSWILTFSSVGFIRPRLAAFKCEATFEMLISISKSESMVVIWKHVGCPLWVGGKILPQVKETKRASQTDNISSPKLDHFVLCFTHFCETFHPPKHNPGVGGR